MTSPEGSYRQTELVYIFVSIIIVIMREFTLYFAS